MIAFDLSTVILLIFAIALVVTTICIICSSSLIQTIILISINSILIALCYLMMDAPDVAMTEAALGASLSTVVMLSFAKKMEDNLGASSWIKKVLALLICIFLAITIIYSISDLVPYGAYNEALQNHINSYYLQNTETEIGIPSFVAAILASYRGYDTLGETAVILTGAIAVMLILPQAGGKNAK